MTIDYTAGYLASAIEGAQDNAARHVRDARQLLDGEPTANALTSAATAIAHAIAAQAQLEALRMVARVRE